MITPFEWEEAWVLRCFPRTRTMWSRCASRLTCSCTRTSGQTPRKPVTANRRECLGKRQDRSGRQSSACCGRRHRPKWTWTHLRGTKLRNLQTVGMHVAEVVPDEWAVRRKPQAPLFHVGPVDYER